MALQSNGVMVFNLADTSTSVGSGAGPQFTETAEDNIWIVLFYGSASAAWDFKKLTGSDDDEPFTFTAASITAAGPTNDAALRTAINADSSVIAMLVDPRVAGIDIANLTYEAPEPLAASANAAFEVEFSAAAPATLGDAPAAALQAAATASFEVEFSAAAPASLGDAPALAATANASFEVDFSAEAAATLGDAPALAATANASFEVDFSAAAPSRLGDAPAPPALEAAATASFEVDFSAAARAFLRTVRPTADPIVVLLSLQADTSDGLTRGYPDEILLSGDVVMDAWQPAEAQVETRTLRAFSDVEGPAIHGRTRSLVQEQIFLLLSDAELVEHTSRFLNAINGGHGRGWLRVQKQGDTNFWRSPVYGGSMQLDGDSFRYGRGRRRFRLTVIREPWFESTAAAADLGRPALRSRTPITLTGPDAGTVAAPLLLSVQASSALATAVRIHLFQDRAVPATWTAGYSMSASSSGTDGGGHNRISFSTGRPAGKDLGRTALYQPVLIPTSGANAAIVRSMRDAEALTVGYGNSASDVNAETEVGVLGRMAGAESIFSGVGLAAVDEDDDYYVATAYASEISGTGWRLVNVPADGYLAEVAAGTVALAGGPLYLGPEERCVIVPLIETVGSAGAEYNGTALSLQVLQRARVSEII